MYWLNSTNIESPGGKLCHPREIISHCDSRWRDRFAPTSGLGAKLGIKAKNE
jgi:hypothetical protein